MRLIDAEKLLDAYAIFGITNISREDVRDELYDLIDNQPTAYDTDKVVEELEKLQKETFSYAFKYNDSFYDGQSRGLDKAIEIVKRGGSNEK